MLLITVAAVGFVIVKIVGEILLADSGQTPHPRFREGNRVGPLLHSWLLRGERETPFGIERRF